MANVARWSRLGGSVVWGVDDLAVESGRGVSAAAVAVIGAGEFLHPGGGRAAQERGMHPHGVDHLIR